MITCVINGNGIAEFEYVILQHYKSAFSAHLPADIGVLVGDVVQVIFYSTIGATTISMEVIEYSDAQAGRWHILLMPAGSTLLGTDCIPTYISKPNASNIINALYPGYPYNIIANPVFLQNNITIPGNITNFKALSRYFGTDIRYDFYGVLQIGTPIPTVNVGQFSFMNFSSRNRIIEVGFGESDFIINPGDIIFNGCIVKNITYTSTVTDLRAQIKITDDSPYPSII